VSDFALSPGITPEITDAFVLAVPLAIGLGYLLYGRRGVEVAFGLSALALGLVKFATDLPDLWDDLVSLGATLGGAGWVALALRPLPRARALTVPILLFGIFAILVGGIKLNDFYDPFDLLLADASILAGVAWLVHLRRERRPRAGAAEGGPRSADGPA
jgi:hypothetical protein